MSRADCAALGGRGAEIVDFVDDVAEALEPVARHRRRARIQQAAARARWWLMGSPPHRARSRAAPRKQRRLGRCSSGRCSSGRGAGGASPKGGVTRSRRGGGAGCAGGGGGRGGLRSRCRRIWPQRRRRRTRLGARSAHRLGFDLADRVFERQPLARDVRLRERRIDAAQLRHQGRARPLVERPASFAGAGAKAFDGAGDERVIVCHFTSLRLLPVFGSRKFHLKLQTDFA